MIRKILCFFGVHFYVHNISKHYTDEWICSNCKKKEPK